MDKKFVVEINYDHYQKRIGYLIEAEDESKANGIAQRHFLSSHPDESILSTRVIEIDVSLMCSNNPSSRNLEEKA